VSPNRNQRTNEVNLFRNPCERYEGINILLHKRSGHEADPKAPKVSAYGRAVRLSQEQQFFSNDRVELVSRFVRERLLIRRRIRSSWILAE
jgi:hypothetical protein